MAEHIKIRKISGTWSVRAGGAVLGETKNALEVSEADNAPIIYFPRSDIAMAFLDQTGQTTQCMHKGVATYFSVVTKSTTLENAVWSYEAPKAGVEAIKDHLAFFTGALITIENT